MKNRQLALFFCTMNLMKALVLSGGGARGAYQVGVIQAIAEIAKENHLKNPFEFFCGVSAGSINSAYMASTCDRFFEGAESLVQLWGGLTSEQVFRTDVLSLGRIGFKWIEELSLGAIAGSTPGRSLLDTSPLYQLLSSNLNYSKIQENLSNQHFKGLAITALDYRTSETITFVQGDPELSSWEKPRKRSERAFIQPEHIMASSAIPILFPPTPVGNRHFGDGCIRNMSPLSPAIHLGADQLLVVGVRRETEIFPVPQNLTNPPPPSVAKVTNVLLNSVLLDGIEVDLDRLSRINEFLRRVPAEHQSNLNFKPLQSLFISPSGDIGKMASQLGSRLPRVIRYLLKGLGPLEDASEIISYLLFEKEFMNQLIDLGFGDGMAKKKEITRFLLESRPQSLDWEGF